jgi:uncharacterized protein YbjT (DUF2867 family)
MLGMTMTTSPLLTRRGALGVAAVLTCLLATVADAADGPRVLVAGATGRTGSYIIREARDAGFEVRAMTRDPARAAERLGDDWDWIEADVRDPAALAIAMQGVDYVICTIGARSRSGPDGPEFVDYGGVRNLVDAGVDAGLRHFVLISSAAAGPHRKRGRLSNIRYWKTRGEDHLKLSGLDYTIIGPGGLLQESGGSSGVRVLSRRDYGVGRIAMGDVARIAVHALTDPNARNKSFAAIWDDRLAPGDWPALLAALPADIEGDEAPPTAGDSP